MVYDWKSGARIKADAGKVYDELQKIGDEITAGQVVKIARNKKTELHKCFEWDDNIAAHEFRKDQARKVMHSIVIIKNPEDDNPIIFRAYENVTVEDGKAYVQIEQALSKEEWREEVFSQIRKGIEQLEMKAEAYENMDITLKKVKHKLRAVKELVTV